MYHVGPSTFPYYYSQYEPFVFENGQRMNNNEKILVDSRN